MSPGEPGEATVEVLPRRGARARRLLWAPAEEVAGRRRVAVVSDAGRLACPSRLSRLLGAAAAAAPPSAGSSPGAVAELPELIVVRWWDEAQLRQRRPPLPLVGLQAARWGTLPVSLVPVAIGLLSARAPASLALPVLATVLLVHAAANLAGEAFDHVGGSDALLRFGGSKVLQQGFASARGLATAAAVLGALGMALGLRVALRVADPAAALWAGATGLLLAWQWSAPPLRFGRHAAGGPLLLAIMGPGLAAVTALAVAGQVPRPALLLGALAMVPLAIERHLRDLRRLPDDGLEGRATVALRLGYRASVLALAALAALLAVAPPLLIIAGGPKVLAASLLAVAALVPALRPALGGYGPHDPSLSMTRRRLAPVLAACRALLLVAAWLWAGAAA